MPVVERPDGRHVLLDAAGAPVGSYEHSERAGAVYADLFDREPEVSPEHAAEAVLAELGGMRIAGDEALGLALVARGGRPVRHAHLMSHDLAERPPEPRLPGYRLTDVDRPATELMDAYRAAYAPGHIDHRDEPLERSRADLQSYIDGNEFGPLLPGSGLALHGDAVVGAILVGALHGDPPVSGPWVIELFRHPAHRGIGRALLERALARAAGPALGLMVTEGNRARRLYEAVGFRLVHTALVVQL